MTTTKTRVLVVGATGKMGAKIVRELLALGSATVRITRRAGSNADDVAKLTAAGAEVVTADLADAASLAAACGGVDVIVSSVQGPRDVIVDGQTRLLRAAEQAGVARLIPSDYSLDFWKTREGGNRNLDLRREFNGTLDASKVRGTSVLCGAFMDLLAMGAMDRTRRPASTESGATRISHTTSRPPTTRRSTSLRSRSIATPAGTSASPATRCRRSSSVRSSRSCAVSRRRSSAPASIDDLEHLISKLRAADEAPANIFPVWQQLQYARDMASGRGRLAPLDNARYPSVRPKTVREFLRA